MALEDDLAIHDARPTLEQKILTALKASGKDPARLTPDDLAPVDEFHVGGRQVAPVEMICRLERS